MTTTSSVSDLASDYVRECLGFASSPASKVPALHRVRFSLASCYYDPDADADAIAASERPTREWRRFLEGGGTTTEATSWARRISCCATA
jgi:hypothetical protein